MIVKIGDTITNGPRPIQHLDGSWGLGYEAVSIEVTEIAIESFEEGGLVGKPKAVNQEKMAEIEKTGRLTCWIVGIDPQESDPDLRTVQCLATNVMPERVNA